MHLFCAFQPKALLLLFFQTSFVLSHLGQKVPASELKVSIQGMRFSSVY